MKLQRLIQPRNPLFWLFVLINALSSLLGWIANTYALPGWVAAALVVFALGNAVLGMRIAWRLVHT